MGKLKMFKMKLLVSLATLWTLIIIGSTERTADYIYNDVEAIGACFRRLNATDQIGCNSGRKGNVGVLHYISNETSLDWLLDKGPHEPYVALMTPDMFTRDNVRKLEKSDKVAAILLIRYDDDDIPSNYSPDSSCPNNEYDLYTDDDTYKKCRNQTWNPSEAANNLMYEDHDIPIVALKKEKEVNDLITDCYEKHNEPTSDGKAQDPPLCAAEVKVAMDAAVDSETCLRRSNMITNLNPQVYCDHMGGYNIFGFLPAGVHENDEAYDDGELILASARLDSFSMFDGLYPSADSTITGIVTLLAVAETLGRFKDDFNTTNRPIMLNFFNGEAFDYIGSRRTLFEMKNNDYPYTTKKKKDKDDILRKIEPQNIGAYIELSQLGLTDENSLWIHTDPVSREDATVNEEVEGLITWLENYASDASLPLDATPRSQPLPPASVQTFLKERSFPAVVIADHKHEFTNQYYNSIYDLASFINADYPNGTDDEYNYVTDAAAQLAKIATVTSRMLYNLSTSEEAPADLVANETVVANLLYCYLHEPQTCELFKQVLTDEDQKAFEKSDRVAWSFYVGVFSSSKNWVTHITHNVMAYYLGEWVSATNKECDNKNKKRYLHTYTYMQGWVADDGDREGVCIKATVNYTKAVSPVFDEVDNYDWSSGKYPTWTESRWASDAISVRFFMQPPLYLELLLLFAGMLMVGLSLAGIYFLINRLPITTLFPTPDDPNASPQAFTRRQTPINP